MFLSLATVPAKSKVVSSTKHADYGGMNRGPRDVLDYSI